MARQLASLFLVGARQLIHTRQTSNTGAWSARRANSSRYSWSVVSLLSLMKEKRKKRKKEKRKGCLVGQARELEQLLLVGGVVVVVGVVLRYAQVSKETYSKAKETYCTAKETY